MVRAMDIPTPLYIHNRNPTAESMLYVKIQMAKTFDIETFRNVMRSMPSKSLLEGRESLSILISRFQSGLLNQIR